MEDFPTTWTKQDMTRERAGTLTRNVEDHGDVAPADSVLRLALDHVPVEPPVGALQSEFGDEVGRVLVDPHPAAADEPSEAGGAAVTGAGLRGAAEADRVALEDALPFGGQRQDRRVVHGQPE